MEGLGIEMRRRRSEGWPCGYGKEYTTLANKAVVVIRGCDSLRDLGGIDMAKIFQGYTAVNMAILLCLARLDTSYVLLQCIICLTLACKRSVVRPKMDVARETATKSGCSKVDPTFLLTTSPSHSLALSGE